MMGTMPSLFVAAFGLGITCALLPGPVVAEALRRGLTAGARAAIPVRLGSLAGTLSWAAVAFAGGGVIVRYQPAYLLLSAAGTVVLMWMVWTSLVAFAGRPAAVTGRAPTPATGGFLTGAVLTLASPFEPVFWLAVSGAVLTANQNTPGREAMQAATFLAGVALADLVGTAALCMAIAYGRRHVSPRSLRWVQLLAAGVVGYFGLRLLMATAQAI